MPSISVALTIKFPHTCLLGVKIFSNVSDYTVWNWILSQYAEDIVAILLYISAFIVVIGLASRITHPHAKLPLDHPFRPNINKFKEQGSKPFTDGYFNSIPLMFRLNGERK